MDNNYLVSCQGGRPIIVRIGLPSDPRHENLTCPGLNLSDPVSDSTRSLRILFACLWEVLVDEVKRYFVDTPRQSKGTVKGNPLSKDHIQ
jgi:hypothetical protein